MSAQELYNIMQSYLFKEKEMLHNNCDQNDDYIMGRWASLMDLESFLNKLDPEIFPDPTEDER